MSIWFYLFLITISITLILIIKIIIIKTEIKNIFISFKRIIESDTNNLITINTNDKALKTLTNTLNKNLKELRRLELEYKNGNKELKSSITNISHDLRTPLTSIKSYLDLLDSKNLNKKQIEYLSIIDNKVNDLINLTEQLFDFSKYIDTQKEIKKDNIYLNDILEDTLVSFYSLFKIKNITPEINICKNKVIKLLNENMIKRIFENIISNALKYSEGNFKVTMNNDGTIEFSNKTSLIDSTSIEKLFDRYYTVQNAKKSIGIGLSIAKQLTDLNEGTIEAKCQNDSLIIRLKF